MNSAEQEREAVVAWLRAEADLSHQEQLDKHPSEPEWLYLREQVETYHVAADAIERGEHLKQEEG